MKEGNERGNIEVEMSEDDLDFLKFGVETISFTESYVGEVLISCDPGYTIKKIARGLHSLCLPLRSSDENSRLSSRVGSNSSVSPVSPTIINIANTAYDIWQSHFSQKMKEALHELAIEVHVLTAIALAKKFPAKFNLTNSVSLLNAISKGLYKDRRRRLAAPKRGGARRKRNESSEPDQLIIFAYYVGCLKLLWTHIINFVEEFGYRSESINEVKRTKVYSLLSESLPVPSKLLERFSIQCKT